MAPQRTAIIAAVTATAPCPSLVGDRNWKLAARASAPSGTTTWKACTSTGSRLQASRSSPAHISSPASSSMAAAGEWKPGSHFG